LESSKEFPIISRFQEEAIGSKVGKDNEERWSRRCYLLKGKKDSCGDNGQLSYYHIIYLADLDQEVTMQRRSRPAGGKDGLLLDAAQTGGSMVEMTNGRISDAPDLE